MGIVLLLRTGLDTSYATDVLPAMLVFAVGLSMTVAPLTATVLADAEESDAGIASAVNNAVARVAGLIGVSILGVVVAETLVGDTFAANDESVRAFHQVVVVCAVLVAGGGTVVVLGIVNPRRTVEARNCPGGQLVAVTALLVVGSPGVRTGSTAVLGSVIQWSGVALCAFGTYYLWTRYLEAETNARTLELARSANDAMLVETRLRSLRQQIEPHFLFNTLATIRRLNEIDSSEGARLLRHLVNYLRSATNSEDRLSSVGKEADLAASYLGIVAIRMGGRLRFTIDVPAQLRRCKCPPLVVATLVENAVKHGVAPCSDQATIGVFARERNGLLEVRVEDTGVGISSSAETTGGTGIGLANIQAQLALYAQGASLSIERNEPRGVRAVVRLPVDWPDA